MSRGGRAGLGPLTRATDDSGSSVAMSGVFQMSNASTSVTYGSIQVDGLNIAFREAGSSTAPLSRETVIVPSKRS